MNINRSHPPHGGKVAAENSHKSSTEGTERGRDELGTQAERPRPRRGSTDVHRDPSRPRGRFKKPPSEWSHQFLQQTDATRHRTALNTNSGLQTLPSGMLPLGTLGNTQKPGPAGLGGGRGNLQGGRERSAREEIMVGGAEEERRTGRR